MTKIAFVILYTGKLPEYFELFVHTCKQNAGVDFIIFCDSPRPKYLPANVHFHSMSLAEFGKLADEKLGLKTNIVSGYKLCDFKPLCGFLFADYLTAYDFWGHCDLDLLLADILNYFPKTIFEENDIISVRKEWISGSFALYRNNSTVNELFKKSKDWQYIFEQKSWYRFDECGTMKEGEAMAYHYIQKGVSILDLDSEVESMTHLIEKIKHKTLDLPIRIYQQTCIKESLSPDMLLKYDRGSITMLETKANTHPKGSSYLHYHYITEKKNPWFRFPKWDKIPDSFYIDDTGFYLEAELPKRAQIRSKRKIEGNLKYWMNSFPKKVIKKLLGK